jgi:hypothetical protein
MLPRLTEGNVDIDTEQKHCSHFQHLLPTSAAIQPLSILQGADSLKRILNPVVTETSVACCLLELLPPPLLTCSILIYLRD